MLIKAGIGVVMTLAVVGTTLQITMPPRPKILYNPSSSAPIGWYQVTDNPSPKRHDLIAAYAPEWARRLGEERSYLPYDYPLVPIYRYWRGTVWDAKCPVNLSGVLPLARGRFGLRLLMCRLDLIAAILVRLILICLLAVLSISEMAESQNVEDQWDLRGDWRVLGNAR